MWSDPLVVGCVGVLVLSLLFLDMGVSWRRAVFGGRKSTVCDYGVPLVAGVHTLISYFQKAIKHAARYWSPSPVPQVLEDVVGLQRSLWIYTAVRLKLADAFGDDEEERSLEALALLVGASNSSSLFRLLRALESIGYFKSRCEGSLWRHTPFSRLLCKNDKNSVTSFVEWQGLEVIQPMLLLTECVLDDSNAFRAVKGKALFDYLREAPQDVRRRFAEAQKTQDAISWGSLVLLDDEWSTAQRVVDIGGSTGSLLSHILSAYPEISRGLLFDLTENIKEMETNFTNTHPSLVGKIDFVGGSLLCREELPVAREGDSFLLRNVLHLFEDATALQVLLNIRATMNTTKASEEGKDDEASRSEACEIPTRCSLILIETAPPPIHGDAEHYQIDLNMLVMNKGRERSSVQIRNLLAAAGFRIERITKTRSMYTVFSAVPVPPLSSASSDAGSELVSD